MSSRDRPSTPPQDPKKVQAHLESQRSTKLNKGSSAASQLLEIVQKESVKLGIKVDMERQKHCNPEDMVKFLLALCCPDDHSPASVPCNKDLDKLFDDCYNSVLPITDHIELRHKLENYKNSTSGKDPTSSNDSTPGNDSTSAREEDMYVPFAEAMNYTLELLSDTEVDGLPKFKTHVAFVPCNKGVKSDRIEPGSSFKPDITLMSLGDAYKFHQVDPTGASELSNFITKILRTSPSGSINWKTVLSAIEMKRKPVNFPELGVFTHRQTQVSIIQDVNERLDEKPGDSPPSTATSSETMVSLKRSVGAAGMEASEVISGSKRQRTEKDASKKTTQILAVQNGIYTAEKFSGLFSISHILNLLIENDCLWISWIDREGVIISYGFSFFKNLPLLLVLLLVLQRFGRSQWGYISELDTDSHSVLLHPIQAGGDLGEDEVAVDFFPNDTVHSAWSLLGRATTVVGANRQGGDGRIVEGEPAQVGADDVRVYRGQNSDIRRALEDLFSERSGLGGYDRTGVETATPNPITTEESEERRVLAEEWRAFYRARHEYQETYANTIRSHNLVLKVSWPETSRLEEWKIVGCARVLGEDDKFIKDHIPEVKYAREFNRYSTKHIRSFLGLPQDGSSGTRTLRLIAMKRLWPLYDLDGEQFWTAFWQCVACHYRLWLKGIHHGDISLNNLMYDVSAKTGVPVGVLNDFDLASLAHHSTTNNDRTGTIPFMAIDLLNGGLDSRIPRFYRHNMESFCWVLAYVTVANIEYKGCTIKISPFPGADAWFKDGNKTERNLHISSKRLFYLEYDQTQGVSPRYQSYLTTITRIAQYWSDFHQLRRPPRLRPITPVRATPVVSEPETDDPARSLRSLIRTVGESFKGAGTQEGFAELEACLLEAIGTPTAAVDVDVV